MWGFYYIIFRTSSLAFTFSTKDSKLVYKYSLRENKWSFAAFFVNGFKYYIIVYAALFAVFGVIFAFTLENYMFVFITTVILSTLPLYMVIPFFIKFVRELNSKIKEHNLGNKKETLELS